MRSLALMVFGFPTILTAVAHAAAVSEAKPLIQIGVEVVEVNETKAQQLGITWFSNLHVEEAAVPSVLKVGTLMRTQIFADIEALVNEGAADLLANPKLVTQDGTSATFHAGGELPYATSAGLGTTTVEFKPYGVEMKIQPRLNAGKIELSLTAEVSGPDTQNSVTLSGNTVPALRSRRLSSQLTMDPGSTLTLAGLIQTDKEWTRTGVPGLMRIPLLGYLFSHKIQKSLRTSIVVFVTPTVLNETSTAFAPPSAVVPKAATPRQGDRAFPFTFGGQPLAQNNDGEGLPDDSHL